ncbi:MAG: Ig-like domain-containing protein [Myxococcales bacterium]
MSWLRLAPNVRSSALLVGVSLALLSRSAHAAPCGRPDVDLTFPPDGATAVPSNAILAAHYGSPARYADEAISLLDATGRSVAVTLAYDDADSMLRATPDQPLAAGHFDLVWPGLRGVSGSGGVGRGRSVGFTVTSTLDATPPVFEGLSDIGWDLARDRDPCLDRLDDRFVFQLRVGQASDDSGSALLSLLVFETEDPAAPAQTEPSRVGVRAWPTDGKLEVRRPAKNAGQTCFAAVAQDLIGSVSGGGERQVCVKTQKPPFFDGCAVSVAGSTAPGASASAWVALLALAALRRGRAAHARTPRAV